MTCWLQSQCILQPESAIDVSKVVLISSYLGNNFSVRSGGHNPNIGFSSIGQDGILVDLAQLNDITLSADGTIASIGPGNRWGRVYETLGDSGLSAVGGRANDIGVGGYLLGGGLSYWSSIYGMAFDMIVNYEVCSHYKLIRRRWSDLRAGRTGKFVHSECKPDIQCRLVVGTERWRCELW